jgi:hypothetical protein
MRAYPGLMVVRQRSRRHPPPPPFVGPSLVCSAFGDTSFCFDWLLERGGLETSVSRETFAKENPREYWRNFESKPVSILLRMSSPSVRYDFRR